MNCTLKHSFSHEPEVKLKLSKDSRFMSIYFSGYIYGYKNTLGLAFQSKRGDGEEMINCNIVAPGET